jgi:hypothetical protein
MMPIIDKAAKLLAKTRKIFRRYTAAWDCIWLALSKEKAVPHSNHNYDYIERFAAIEALIPKRYSDQNIKSHDFVGFFFSLISNTSWR